MVKMLIAQDFTKIPNNYWKILVDNNFIIPKYIDELEVMEVLSKFEQYSSETMTVTLVTTYDCNLNCAYCYYGKEKQRVYLRSTMLNRIKKFIIKYKKAYKFSKNETVYYGGEPLLNFKIIKEFGKILSDIFGENYVTGIITNGTLITGDIMQELLAQNINYIQITLDGPKEVHDVRRPFKNGLGSFEKILNNLITVVDTSSKHRLDIVVRVNIDKSNLEYIPRLLEILSSHKLNKRIALDFSSVHNVNFRLGGSVCNADHILSLDEFSLSFIDLVKTALQMGFQFVWAVKPRLIPCGAVSIGNVCIDPYGDLYACWETLGEKVYSIGNVDSGFNDRFYKWLSWNIFNISECRRCEILPLCLGGCPARWLLTNSGPECSISKPFLLDFLRLKVLALYRDEITDMDGGTFG